VPDRGAARAFVLEPRDQIRVDGPVGAEELQRDHPVMRHVDRLEDDSHAAFAELLLDLVLAVRAEVPADEFFR
jgi:hypothetical protein